MRYRLTGRVIRGEGWGRKIGYPTANLDLASFRRQPVPNGVYAGWVRIGRHDRRCLAIIGVPYTWRRRGFKVEIHVLDYAKSLVGKKLSAILIKKLRVIRAFRNVPAMLKQIDLDVRRSRRSLTDDTRP